MTEFMGDPFGGQPGDLQQPAPEYEPAAVTAALPEAPLSYTFKVGGNLFTLRASDAKGFMSIAQDVIGADLVSVAATLNKVAASHSETAPPAPALAQQAAAPAATQQPQQGNGQSCPHGPLVFTSWNAKDGSKVYKAYKCPAKVRNFRDPNSCEMTVWAN